MKRNRVVFASQLATPLREAMPAPTTTKQFHMRRLHSQWRKPKSTASRLTVRTDLPTKEELEAKYAYELHRGRELSKNFKGE